jgi:hypothetical protein
MKTLGLSIALSSVQCLGLFFSDNKLRNLRLVQNKQNLFLHFEMLVFIDLEMQTVLLCICRI